MSEAFARQIWRRHRQGSKPRTSITRMTICGMRISVGNAQRKKREKDAVLTFMTSIAMPSRGARCAPIEQPVAALTAPLPPLASGLELIRPSLAPQGHDAQATPPPHDVDGLTTAELDEITACRGNSDRCRLVPSVAGSGSASSLGARDPVSIAEVTPSYRTPSADGWQARSEREPLKRVFVRSANKRHRERGRRLS